MKILAMAGDAGGARSLIPVIRRLISDTSIRVECRAYTAAMDIWNTSGFQPRPVLPIELRGFDRILLGTTVGPRQWELHYISQARILQIRTVSILDFWMHYRERFTTNDGEFILPDAIAVMDERARQEMISAAFPAQCLRVTGQPAFDECSKYDEKAGRTQNRTNRCQATECSDTPLSVLYVSQPLSQLFARDELGFHEQDVLIEIVAALGRILEHRAVRAVMYI